MIVRKVAGVRAATSKKGQGAETPESEEEMEKSFINLVRKVISDFVAKMDATTQVLNREKSALSIYNSEEQKKRLAEFEGIAGQLTEKARAAASEKLSAVIERGRSFFTVAAIEVDVEEITKLEKIFSMGIPSEFVIDQLINVCSGSYWGLCFLADKLNDGTAAGILHAPIRPDLGAYNAILDEIEGACKSFIISYNGTHTLTQVDENASGAILMMDNSTWDNWRGRLDGIAPAFATDLTISTGALSVNDRRLLNTLVNANHRSEAEISARVIKLAQENKYYETLLLKSQYAPIVAAWLDQKEAEQLQKTAAYTPFESIAKV